MINNRKQYLKIDIVSILTNHRIINNIPKTVYFL